MPRPQRAPRFYFSLRSPYSWLALHDLRLRYPDVADAVEWRPFWEPEPDAACALEADGAVFPYTPMSKEKHLYILQDVKRLAAERGLTVTWPMDQSPRWEVPHLPWFLACDAGSGREWAQAVSAARWQRGLDICDVSVVSAIGAEIGLDPDAVARAAEAGPDEASRAALLDVARDSVFGVPYFVVRRDRFWGLDRLPAFARRVRDEAGPAVPDEPAYAATVPVTATFDEGPAGGCG